MYKFILLPFIGLFFVVNLLAQNIIGEWVSEKTSAYKLHNGTATRVYSININNSKKITGQSSIFFKIKAGFIKTDIVGSIDTNNKSIVLHTVHMQSSIDGSNQHMKDFNNYKYYYTTDSVYEYLQLVLNEQYPHIMLDSVILFSRLKAKPSVTLKNFNKKDTATIIHPANKRSNTLYKIIDVDTDEIKVDLYDIGDIDGDSVTLLLNSTIVAEHIFLKAIASSFNLKLDKTLAENSIILFAENLGSIPPNSSYMIITANKKVYKISMQSNEATNAEIIFRFKKL